MGDGVYPLFTLPYNFDFPLKKFVLAKLGSIMPIDEENYSDAARGLHWYCVDNHSGMSSDLYSIQCQLQYSPSPSENGASDEDYSGYVYECLVNGIMQPDEILEVMKEND